MQDDGTYLIVSQSSEEDEEEQEESREQSPDDDIRRVEGAYKKQTQAQGQQLDDQVDSDSNTEIDRDNDHSQDVHSSPQ